MLILLGGIHVVAGVALLTAHAVPALAPLQGFLVGFCAMSTIMFGWKMAVPCR